VLFLVPLLFSAATSLASRGPYGRVEWTFNLWNYHQALDPLYLGVLWRSVWIAAATTAICLVVAYPVAYFIAIKAPARWKPLLVVLAVAPFWTSFLVRTYAWRFLLQEDGYVTWMLAVLGLADVRLLYTETAVLLGQVYGELPFMILPVYASLERLDLRLLEAARDLGASSATVFWRITMPLTRAGIVAGVVLVFIPSLGAFVTPDLLGGSRSLMVGNLIQNQFVQRNQPFGAALSFTLTVVVMVLLGVAWRALQRTSADERP
jgi:spermidine/putrescine transport system permease protein